jgi:hypothetical protein
VDFEGHDHDVHFCTKYTLLRCSLSNESADDDQAYIVSLTVKSKDAPLACVVVMLICAMFSGQTPTLAEMRDGGPINVFCYSISYAR